MSSRPPSARLSLALLGLSLALLLTACGGDDDGSASPTTTFPRTVQTFPVQGGVHVQGSVAYPQVPPVGGDHNPVWQNCGYYSKPVAPERAVHSMEHGAVWITYRPGLAAADVDSLHRLARSRTYVLVSPWQDASLPAPIVASAWGVQLKLEHASDPALASFVSTYAGGRQAPEPGAPCTGAFGTPE